MLKCTKMLSWYVNVFFLYYCGIFEKEEMMTTTALHTALHSKKRHSTGGTRHLIGKRENKQIQTQMYRRTPADIPKRGKNALCHSFLWEQKMSFSTLSRESPQDCNWNSIIQSSLQLTPLQESTVLGLPVC